MQPLQIAILLPALFAAVLLTWRQTFSRVLIEFYAAAKELLEPGDSRIRCEDLPNSDNAENLLLRMVGFLLLLSLGLLGVMFTFV